jgi:hypothetical protein
MMTAENSAEESQAQPIEPNDSSNIEHAVAAILYKHVKMEDTRISIEQGHFSELVRELVLYIRTGVYKDL